MRLIAVTGTPPARINENARFGDWSASFDAGAARGEILFADVVGLGASWFDASFDRALGLVGVTPMAAFDFEWFRDNALPPQVAFSLRFFLADGTQAQSRESWTVEVLDADDTPPEAVGFAEGGVVAAGQPGATIGRLSVRDADTRGGFTFTLSEDDAVLFTVVGDTLRLRDGMSLPASDGPVRSVMLEVSDGRQSAGFLLPFTITAPGDGLALDLLETWEAQSGFGWTAPGVVTAARGAWSLSSLDVYGDGLLRLGLAEGGALWLESPERVELLNGRLDFRPTGSAAQLWLTFEALLGRAPVGADAPLFTGALDGGGYGLGDLVRTVLSSPEFAVRNAGRTEGELLRHVFAEVSGRLPSAEALAWHESRMGTPEGRATVLTEVISWALETDGAMAARAATGFWVPRPFANEVGALYLAALGREPDPGLLGWADHWARGLLSREQIAEFFLTLPEGAGRFAGVDNAGFVRMLYNAALGREPEAEGFAAWTGALAAQSITRGDAVLGFAFSPEAQARFAALPPGDVFGL